MRAPEIQKYFFLCDTAVTWRSISESLCDEYSPVYLDSEVVLLQRFREIDKFTLQLELGSCIVLNLMEEYILLIYIELGEEVFLEFCE